MQVSVETLGTLQRKVTVKVPADRLEGQVSERLRELSRTVRLKGFRPGKVPAKVIEQRYGAQVRGEAISELIRSSFSEAVQKESLRPAVPPQIETSGNVEDGEFSYVATFDVLPEIGAIDVSKLKVKRPTATVEDSDVDAMIETLRQQRRTWTHVDRPAQSGDLVLFESVASADDLRVPAEGSERSGTVLGSGAILSDIEKKLIGMSVGDEAEIQVTFPDNYRVEALAGKAATVSLKPVRVSEGKLPEVDDAFMASFGVSDGGSEGFRREVRANLERELRGSLMARLKSDVAEKLVAAHSNMDLPSQMVEAEARGMIGQAEKQAKSQGRKFEAPSLESALPAARGRVAAALLLGELARQNKISLDRNRANEMLASIASTYENPMEVIELYRNDPKMMQSLENRVIEDQVIDWIADHADLTVETLSFSDAMQASRAG